MMDTNNILNEALSALDGQIKVVPPKVPEGAVVVGIELDRDESRSGRYVTAVDQGWVVSGKAVAIKDGHAVRANYVFGRMTNGVPKVSACHFVTCSSCGKKILMPLAVWEAKDSARRNGIEIPREAAGMDVLRDHGRCSCGGKWFVDVSEEKSVLAGFAEKVIDSIANSSGPVPAFLSPKAFTVAPAGTAVKPLAKEWEWLLPPMAAQGKVVGPFDAAIKGDAIVFNPGYWIGHIADPDLTDLFWVEGGKAKKPDRPHFNPAGVDGL